MFFGAPQVRGRLSHRNGEKEKQASELGGRSSCSPLGYVASERAMAHAIFLQFLQILRVFPIIVSPHFDLFFAVFQKMHYQLWMRVLEQMQIFIIILGTLLL